MAIEALTLDFRRVMAALQGSWLEVCTMANEALTLDFHRAMAA